MGDNFTNNGINNGHMGPVNNFGRPPRKFTDKDKAFLAQHLQANVPVEINVALGDAEATALAMSIHHHLEDSGFKVKTNLYIPMGKQRVGLGLSSGGNPRVIEVGANL